MTSQQEPDSPFHELPPELRNNIYRLALITDGAIIIDSSTFPQRAALLQTCRTIREEATSIFYAENTFHIPLDGEQNAASIAWLDTFSINLTHVRSLVLRIGLSERYWDNVLAPLAKIVVKRGQTRPLDKKENADEGRIEHGFDRAHGVGLRFDAVAVKLLLASEVSADNCLERQIYRRRIECHMYLSLQIKQSDEIEERRWKELQEEMWRDLEKRRSDPKWPRATRRVFPENDELADWDTE